ncbi:hypothetical protein ACE6ED_23515 [Paenibacillus sp. CN-4]|uniref:hypothetical protein n=1 Tax=Paenibacillus nanchangensis TaxID=3348343 RepID=UPI00397B5B1B
MELTDKEYLMLASVVGGNIAEDAGKGTLQDLISQSAVSSEHGTGTGTQASMHDDMEELLNSGRLGGLVLTERLMLPEVRGYAFRDEKEDNVIIFTYTGESWLGGLQSILGGEGNLVREAAAFLGRSRGEGACSVTGIGLGGSLALFAAAHTDGIMGVVFDAPGVANLLEPEQTGHLLIKNYLAYNSLVSAIGWHTEKVFFAKLPDGMGSELIFDTAGPQHYRFDAEGRIVIGEKGEAYDLFSKLNVLMEDENSRMMQEVSGAFAAAAGEEADLGDWIYTMFALIEQLETDQISEALTDIAGRYDRLIDELWDRWRTEMNASARKLGIDELGDVFSARIEATMLEGAGILEQIFYYSESYLSILILCSPESDKLADRLEEELNRLTDALTGRLERLAGQMTDYLEPLIELQRKSRFQMPQLQFQFAEE